MNNTYLLQKAEKIANMGSWEIDLKTNEVFWSDQFFCICGYQPNSIVPTYDLLIQLVHPDDRDRVDSVFNNCVALGKEYHIEQRIIRPDGSMRHILSHGKTEKNIKGEQQVVGVFIDITNRKKVEEILKENEALYHSVLNSMLEGCQIIDYNWRYVYLNPSAVSQGHYPLEKLVGNTMMEVYPGIENTHLFEVLQTCMKTRLAKHIENKFVYPDGTSGWFELRIQPAVEGLFILSIDITERKKSEQHIKQLNEELEQKVIHRTLELESVNKELESFSYSVSHDLRAPLRAINGYTTMIEEDYTKVLDEEGKRLLSRVQYNTKKMGRLIDDLLTFSRLGKKEVNKTTINMNELIEGVFIDLNKSINYKAEIKIEKLDQAEADYNLINQVFVNLISNAIKYSSKKDHPIIEIKSEKKESEVIYTVSDNGAGFDMKYADKLFGVFQRLHTTEEFEGTGVGLATAQRIIAKHGGRIYAQGELDKGATFSFSLPKK